MVANRFANSEMGMMNSAKKGTFSVKKQGFLQIDLQIIDSSFRICKSICNHHDSTSRFCELVCTHIDSRSQRTQPRPRARHRPAPLAHGPMGPIGPTGSMRPMGPWPHGNMAHGAHGPHGPMTFIHIYITYAFAVLTSPKSVFCCIRGIKTKTNKHQK